MRNIDGSIIKDVAHSGRITRRAGLAEEVYQRVRSDIITARIPPDSRVSVDSLARQLGTSQTPVREALSMLEANGFVTRRQFVGYCTPPQMGHKELAELFEFRLLVEPCLAQRAAESIGPEALAHLREIAYHDTPGHQEFSQLDADFHDLIAHGAQNSLMAESLSRLHIHIQIFRSCLRPEITDEAVREHLTIEQAIRAQDGQAAYQAMKAHVESSYDRLRRFSLDL